MQGAMESCPFKTVISGGMGFALGGAFGLFMSSVSDIEAENFRLNVMLLTLLFALSDELRYPVECFWPTAYRFADAGTTAKGFQRHGIPVVQFCEKLWFGRRHICWNRVLH